MVLDKEGQELRKKLQEYADKSEFKLNPNEKVLEGIINALLRNKKFKGDIYCPCRVVTGNKEEDKKIVCPCIYHKDEIKSMGHCKCMLFWAK
jgi:ferredoxin-thioredoxin reductase catalytic subunit